MPYVPDEVLEMPQGFFFRKAVNLDLSNKCTLACLACVRVTAFDGSNKLVPGHQMTDHEWSLYLEKFSKFTISGQSSDPILHPKLDKILSDIYKAGKDCTVHVAASHKPEKHWIKCFKANPNAIWYFGIDGLPKDSHKYRINQDGEKIFKMMLESRKYLNEKRTIWQYLVFNYNQYDLNECRNIAEKNGIVFNVLESNRIKEFDYDDPNNEIGTVMKNVKFIKNQYGKIKDWQYINEK